MALPQDDDSKRHRTGGRYNFDAAPSDGAPTEPHGIHPDPLRALAEALRDEVVMQQRHKPAPMQKRQKAAQRGNTQKQPGGMGPIAGFSAVIILLSFGLAFDFASGGKIRERFFAGATQQTAATPPPALKKDEPAIVAPEPDKVAEPAPPVMQQAASADVAAAPAPVAEPAASAVAPQPPAPVAEPTQPPVEAPVKPVEGASNDNAAPKIVEPAPQASAPPAQEETADTPEKPAVTAPPPPVKASDAQEGAEPAQAAAGVIPQGQAFRDCANCPEMIAISAGEATAGNDTKPDEPPKIIKIEHAYALGRDDITFDDWESCVQAGACKAIAEDAGWGRGARPQIFVSYDDVTHEYLPWLSRLTGKDYRLPTKDEWQFAALGGGGITPEKPEEVAKACFNAAGPAAAGCSDTFDGTAPVGSFPPNRLGLHDMRGNVWKWSQDCWRPFTYAPGVGADACDTRVVLAGAWSTGRGEDGPLTTAWEKSDRRTNSIGFRVVRSLP